MHVSQSNSNICTKYAQPVKGWTARMCNIFDEKKNVENLLENINDQLIKTAKNFQTKEHPWCVIYEGNINGAIEKSEKRSRALLSKERLVQNKELYSRTLNTIQNCYYDNNEKMTLREKFLLHYFLSRVHAQLHNYDKALRHDEEAIMIWIKVTLTKTSDDWWENLHANSLAHKFNRRMAKHELIVKGPLLVEPLSKEGPRSPEEILTSKTYLEEKTISTNEMIRYYERLRKSKFSELILKMHALNAVEHDTFGIFFSPSMSLEGSRGYYKGGSKVHIGQISIQDNQTTYFHELTHMAMDRLFCNARNPYAIDDVGAQKAYRECMRQVIINVLEDIIPIHELEKLEANQNYTIIIGEPFLMENELYFKTLKVNFPYPWNKSLSAEQLIENCYGDNGLLRNDSLLKETDSILYVGGFEIRKRKVINDSLMIICRNLIMLFTGNYPLSDYDKEFLSYMTENFINDPSYRCSKLIKPFIDYIDKYVYPKMEEYIEEHPSKSKVILENYNFKHLLNNGESILLHKPSTSKPTCAPVCTLYPK